MTTTLTTDFQPTRQWLYQTDLYLSVYDTEGNSEIVKTAINAGLEAAEDEVLNLVYPNKETAEGAFTLSFQETFLATLEELLAERGLLK